MLPSNSFDTGQSMDASEMNDPRLRGFIGETSLREQLGEG